ncbi:MAG: metallophosphoesterase, partial [Phycisphaerae bacterium]
MKLICTADLHQHTPKWEALSAVVEDEKPAFVLIAGDLFPKTGGFKGQHDFFPRFQRNLAKMRDAGAQVLLMMGNDDFLPLEPLVDQLATQELCVNMNGRVHREQGLTFCGVAQVRDYPFAY